MPEPEVSKEAPAPVPGVPAPSDSPAGNGSAPKEPEIVSDKFAALAKKEKGIFRKAQELAEREKAFEPFKKQYEDDRAKLDKIKADARLNPVEALKELGLKYEDVTSYILNQEKPTAEAHIAKMRDEIESFRNQIEEGKKKAQEEAKKLSEERQAQTVQEFQTQIKDFIETKKETYDLIHLFGAQGMIYKGIEDVYRETCEWEDEPFKSKLLKAGRIPTIEESANGVQKLLLEKLDTLIPQTKWFKDKYAPKEAPKEKTPDGASVTQTLSNNMSAGSSNLPAATEAERIRRALEKLQNA